MNQDPQALMGVLSLQRLFIGSKSEGLYPVFDQDDGTRYRIRLIRDLPSEQDPLVPFYGQRVKVLATTDRQRGHWRMTLHANEEGVSGLEMLPVEPESEA